jgi:starch-binding outer membrane protein, SusD/RagB family
MKVKILDIKNLRFTAIFISALLLNGCFDLEVPVESELVPINFPTEPGHFDAAKGPIYSVLPDFIPANEYWRMQTYSTDEHILPARGGNWDDGGVFRTLHRHIWTVDHPHISNYWNKCFSGITSCNQLLDLFETVEEGPLRDANFAELRMMRAFFYYLLLDAFGNVPILRSFDADEPTSPRADVFNFIESEVLEILPDLTPEVSSATYGRPTRWMGHALLHRMYLNAQVYTGTARWNEAIQHANAVINSGEYSLDEDFRKMFWYDNGPQVKEFIFAVVMDAFLAQGGRYSRYSITTELSREKYGMGTRSQSNAHKFQPDYFYTHFDWEKDDETGEWYVTTDDVRNETILIGKQYTYDGDPIYYGTISMSRLNQEYTGPDFDTLWQVEFYPEVILRGDPAAMDCANDLYSQHMGARSIKFYPDPNWFASGRHENNDFPVFRLAEMIMGKAEAMLRAGIDSEGGDTPLSLVNKIRTRVIAEPFTEIDLNILLEERGREFQHEAHRRTDLIRYGKFHDPVLFRQNTSDSYRSLFPVPSDQIQLNPKLQQNPGY